MKNLSDYTKKHTVDEISLGNNSNGNMGYCCTNITKADLFLYIMPKLKECFKTELLQLKNNPKFSNEISPAAVNFYGDDGKIMATYKREVSKPMPVKLTPFSPITYINVAIHNVITFGDSSDRQKFIDKCKELSNGTIDFERMIQDNIPR